MRTKIQKWGNSLALRIPKSFAEEAEVEAGSRVDLSVADGQFVIRPVRSPRFELHALMAGVKEENLHAEISTGEPTGREIW
jgi:antitoxin MazE